MKNIRKYLFAMVIIVMGLFFTSCQPITGLLGSLSPITGKDCDIKLLGAIDDGNLELIKEAVEDGANINLVETTNLIKRKISPLFAAMKRKYEPAIKYLLEQGADPNYIDENGISLLMYSVGAEKMGANYDNVKSLEYSKLLLKHGIDVNKTVKSDTLHLTMRFVIMVTLKMSLYFLIMEQ